MNLSVLFAYFLIFIVVVTSVGFKRKSGVNLLNMRIVGGHPAVRENWPFIAVIAMGPVPLCGGSLVREDWVLTAAHCIDPEAYFGFTNYPLGVGIGVIELTPLNTQQNESKGSYYFRNIIPKHRTIEAPTIKDFTIEDHHIFHPEYKIYKIGVYVFYANDIALIKLSKPVDLSEGHSLAKLAHQEPLTGTECLSAGWGIEKLQTSVSNNKNNILFALELIVKDQLDCFNAIASDIIKTNKTELEDFSADLHKSLDDKVCAMPLKVQDDMSVSDDGGPLSCTGVQYGVLSGKKMPSFDNTSRKETYIFFTEISKHLNWITKSLETYEPSKPQSTKRTTKEDILKFTTTTSETTMKPEKEGEVRAQATKYEQRAYMLILMLVYILYFQ